MRQDQNNILGTNESAAGDRIQKLDHLHRPVVADSIKVAGTSNPTAGSDHGVKAEKRLKFKDVNILSAGNSTVSSSVDVNAEKRLAFKDANVLGLGDSASGSGLREEIEKS